MKYQNILKWVSAYLGQRMQEINNQMQKLKATIIIKLFEESLEKFGLMKNRTLLVLDQLRFRV